MRIEKHLLCKTCLLLGAFAFIGSAVARSEISQDSANDRLWAPLGFLLGEWVGEGSGGPGQGTGGFSFKWDLEKRILVRQNSADYPATADRQAFSHHDLTIIYPDPAGNQLKAIYFDNEGHVIHYQLSIKTEDGSLQWVSEAAPSSPTYRLTYKKTGEAKVSIKFEIAPPGKPDAFANYIEATAMRK